MAAYKLTADADADFTNIYAYSLETYGERQADTYTSALITGFEIIGSNPFIGRDISSIKPGARCLFHERHSIYYRLDDSGIVIFRILNQTQDPLQQL
ncbi:type II toxin-antitoxin system RelE/ParE family toxin [Asticcacaulis machinosus]|uniref:Toxin n=1 Tax=Asticcacaulis machinosus TaxID=2984211 RepID=A0ABT5HI69_9CAUL|nr:type II toxin-antitoxin system RelE/ParE family toxin [Asticcacaulis machinosus]MDC7675836.1 type II toxin-antitoxin system RelE/ParE family toxin [Asticcacaulis machinosus]